MSDRSDSETEKENAQKTEPINLTAVVNELMQLRAELRIKAPREQEQPQNTPRGKNLKGSTGSKGKSSIAPRGNDPSTSKASMAGSVTGDIDNYLDNQSEREAIESVVTTDVEDEEEGEIEEDQEDWIEEFAGSYGNAEATGPDLPNNLATLITKMLKTRLTDDKEKQLLEEFKRPDNVPMLGNPRVNSDVWSKLKPATKTADLKLAKAGEKITKALTANAQVASQLSELRQKVLGETRKVVKEVLKTTLDALQVGAAALQDINQRRRDNMRFDLHPSYRSLCNVPKEETETLLGDDLSDKVKTISQANSLGVRLGSHGEGNRRPFLGQYRQQNHQNQFLSRRPRQREEQRHQPYQRGRGRGRGQRK